MSISVKNIDFYYDEKQVLKNVTLKIPKNEIWALLGKSGVGKTTLLHIIAGLYKPRKGRISIDSRNEGPGCIRGVVFQEECLLGWLTVEQNLLFPEHRNASNDYKNRAKKILEAVGLGNQRQSLPYELSTGMRKRLEFARALVVDKEYILADEPFGTVDAVTRMSLWKLWLELKNREPRTGILCTHDPEEAIRLCDAVVTLRRENTAKVVNLIEIPDSIKSLDISEENGDLWELKKKVISSIRGE